MSLFIVEILSKIFVAFTGFIKAFTTLAKLLGSKGLVFITPIARNLSTFLAQIIKDISKIWGFFISTPIDIAHNLFSILKNFSLSFYNLFKPPFFAFANIDEKIINQPNFPSAEKLKLSGLSVWLVINCIFIGFMNYHALKDSIGYDLEYIIFGNNFKANLTAAYAALGISFGVFMFDRYLFYWSFYNDGKRSYEGAKFDVNHYRAKRKWRLALSLAISLIIFLFVMISLFKSSIDNQIRQNISVRNQSVDSEISTFKNNDNDEIKAYDKKINAANARLVAEQQLLASSQSRFGGGQALSTEMETTRAQLTNIETDLKSHREKLHKAECGMSVQREGRNKDDCKVSGEIKDGKGPLYRQHNDDKLSAENVIKRLESEKFTVQSRITSLTQQIRAVEEQNKFSQDDFNTASSGRQEAIQEEINNHVKQKGEFVNKSNERLETFKKSIGYENKLKQVETDFIARFAALVNIFASKQGTQQFAMLIMCFAIFLIIMIIEMLPILTKLYFFTESAYADEVFRIAYEKRMAVKDSFKTIGLNTLLSDANFKHEQELKLKKQVFEHNTKMQKFDIDEIAILKATLDHEYEIEKMRKEHKDRMAKI